jgi:hypothetical protein
MHCSENPIEPKLVAPSEVLWLRVEKRSAALFENLTHAVLLSAADIDRSGMRMQSLLKVAAPFCFGHRSKKVT